MTYANGQLVASQDEAGKLDATGQLTGFSNTRMGRTQVQVQPGDTLKSLAQRVYGNENLWYVLADANGLQGDDALVAGSSLTVPEVKTSSNDASTFKPYNPSEITGPTAPSLPYIAPPSASCDPISTIIMAVVAVMVTVYAPQLALKLATTFGPAVAAGAPVVVGIGAKMAAAGIVAAAASAGARGVASAMGLASFSWRAVAVDGITTALSAGLGEVLKGAGSSAASGKTYTTIDKVRELNTFGRVLQGVGNHAGGMVAQVATGQDTNFSWSGVAAAAVGSYVSAKLGGRVPLLDGGDPSTNPIGGFGQSFLDGAATASARRLFGLGRQNWGQIALDAFGNTIASGVGNELLAQRQSNSQPAPSPDQLADWNRILFEEGRLPAVTLGGPDSNQSARTSPVLDVWFDREYQPDITALQDDGMARPFQRPGAIELALIRGVGATEGVTYTIAQGIKGAAELARDFGGAGLHQLGIMEDYQYSDRIGSLVHGGIEWATSEDPIGAIYDSYEQRYSRAAELDAQGREREAAFIRAGANFEILSAMQGAGSTLSSARRGAMSLAGKLEELGPGPGRYRSQLGAVGDLEKIDLGELNADGRPGSQIGGAGIASPYRLLVFDNVDDFNRAANFAKPDTKHVLGGSSWITDARGRVSIHEGSWFPTSHGRHPTPGEVTQRQIGREGGFEDVGFHIMGDQFNGPINRLNVVPGSGRSLILKDGTKQVNPNLGEYRRFENSVARLAMKTGQPVPTQVRAIYSDGNLSARPDAFLARYQLPNGNWIAVDILNQAGR